MVRPEKRGETDNGILAAIPGEHIAAAMRLTLPDAATATEETLECVYDVPGRGPVRFTFERFRHKHGKTTHWFWTAAKAVPVDTAG